MTRIYQALEQANRERTDVGHAVETVAPSVTVTAPVSPGLDARIEGLYQTVCSMLPSGRGRIVEFISAHTNAGVTTLLSEFARLAERAHGRSVLIIDAALRGNAICGRFGLTPTRGIQEALSNNRPIEEAIVQSGSSHLYVSALSTTGEGHPSAGDEKFANVIDRLRDDYDFILIDAPPVMESPVGLALGGLADGVLVVVEAEKTRWQVAESMRDAIEQNGGNILGVVLNKRQYHIPKFVYDRL